MADTAARPAQLATGGGPTPALTLCGVSKRFGATTVLDGVDLRVEVGSVTVVLGPSGGGKTTLLRIIAGFETPDAGTVTIGDTLVASPTESVPPERRRVGVVPQEGALFPHLDVAGNIGFGLQRGRNARRRVDEMLELVGLAGAGRQRPHELSGGQQHRVALARALAPDPTLVVLDEPFSALDAGLRAQVRAEVLDALRASAATAIVVTHDQLEALSIADEVAVLLDGRIAQAADPATVYGLPESLEVATFVGEAAILPGRRETDRVSCALGSLELAAHCWNRSGPYAELSVVVRPEQVVLSGIDAHTAIGEGERAFGTVASRTYFGHDSVVLVTLDDGTELTARLHASRLPSVGERVAVTVDSAVSAFPVPISLPGKLS